MVLVVVIGACGGSQAAPPSNTEATTPPPAEPASEPPTPVQRSDRQAVELAVKIIGEMAQAAVSSAGSCPQMGQALAPLAIANAELFSHLEAITADEQRSAILDEFREGMDSATTELFMQIGECADDPGVRQAIEAMRG